MTRVSRWAIAVLLVLLSVPSLANAQIVHSVQLGAGWFMPKGFEGRTTGDVLVANLTQGNLINGASGALRYEACYAQPFQQPCTDIGDFRFWNLSGEWNMAFSNRLEASAGLGFYSRTVNSEYRDQANEAQGFAPIAQRTKLRQIPLTGIVRFLPFGRPGEFQPYFGAGIAIVPFRYTETGDFIDPTDLTIFCAGSPGCENPAYKATGTAVGPVLLGGVRFPVGGDIYAFTIEGRYQMVKGDTGGAAAGFLGDKIDLGGGSINFGVLIRF